MTLTAILDGSPFVGYSYAYPHKTTYRALTPPVQLTDVWREENQRALFLYLHIPFCEYRCGFCNLFTQAQPTAELPARYLDQLTIEAERVRNALGNAEFARLAIGGGTPTFLNLAEWDRLFRIVTAVMGAQPRQIPVSVEASPATLDPEKIAMLRERGVDRISLGVQSFDDRDASALGRPQRRAEVEQALELLTAARFPVLNVDLIYGGDSQTADRWRTTLRTALDYRPQEIYLYPLYVRPLTGLGRLAREWDDQRLEAYRIGRDFLLSAGYEQISLRMFRDRSAPQIDGPIYCCQSDGMLGLGCGARSYTRALHYSTEYAVGHRGVAAILDDYLARSASDFDAARHGFRLDADEQRRRYLILSLLQAEGVCHNEYHLRFRSDLLDDFPALTELVARGWAERATDRLRLTAAGLERSDAIGPWLYSPRVQELSASYEMH